MIHDCSAKTGVVCSFCVDLKRDNMKIMKLIKESKACSLLRRLKNVEG